MNKLLLLILAIWLSSSELFANEEPIVLLKCETHQDFMKLGEQVVAANKNTNEMMFLVSTFKKPTGNFLDDSTGYFVHNKDEKNGSFAMLIWLEKQKLCLMFDGIAGKVDGHKFFEDRNKLLKIMKNTINK